MEAEKDRNQAVISAEVEPAQVAISAMGIERRRGTYFDAGEPNGGTTKGDGISGSREERRVIAGTGFDRGKRRSSIG